MHHTNPQRKEELEALTAMNLAPAFMPPLSSAAVQGASAFSSYGGGGGISTAINANTNTSATATMLMNQMTPSNAAMAIAINPSQSRLQALDRIYSYRAASAATETELLRFGVHGRPLSQQLQLPLTILVTDSQMMPPMQMMAPHLQMMPPMQMMQPAVTPYAYHHRQMQMQQHQMNPALGLATLSQQANHAMSMPSAQSYYGARTCSNQAPTSPAQQQEAAAVPPQLLSLLPTINTSTTTSASSSSDVLIVLPNSVTEPNEPTPIPTSLNIHNITSLSVPTDSTFLDPIHNFLRTSCVEIFVASDAHVNESTRRDRPSKVGQVGIRCVFCRVVPREELVRQAVCFPSKCENIYEGVRNIQRIHLDICPSMPDEAKEQYKECLRIKGMNHKPQKAVRAYYNQTASELGLLDTTGGLRFGGTPNLTGKPSKKLLAIMKAAEDRSTSPSFWDRHTRFASQDKLMTLGKFEHVISATTRNVLIQARKECGGPFVFPHDFASTPDIVFLLFLQLVPCKPTTATMKRRGLKPECFEALPGLCCRHCSRQSDSIKGTYFPMDADALGDSSFSQTLSMHLMSCPHVPQDIKHAFNELRNVVKERGITIKRGLKRKFVDKFWKRMKNYGAKKIESGGGGGT